MITTTKRIEQTAQEEGMDRYLEGLQDGLQASRIMERDAFFEIGLTIFAFVVGCFAGWVGANL